MKNLMCVGKKSFNSFLLPLSFIRSSKVAMEHNGGRLMIVFCPCNHFQFSTHFIGQKISFKRMLAVCVGLCAVARFVFFFFIFCGEEIIKSFC